MTEMKCNMQSELFSLFVFIGLTSVLPVCRPQYQMDSEPRPPSCPEHHRQPLNMYCIQDRQLICGLCLTVGQHHGHPVDDLQAAFIREKLTPSQLLKRLSEERWAQVEMTLNFATLKSSPVIKV